jgi:hypothetical protein
MVAANPATRAPRCRGRAGLLAGTAGDPEAEFKRVSMANCLSQENFDGKMDEEIR